MTTLYDMKKIIPLLFIWTCCWAEEAKVFIAETAELNESWKAVLEVKQSTIDSSYWVIEEEIPLSPKEAIVRVLKSNLLEKHKKEAVIVTRCLLWADHLMLRSSLTQNAPKEIPSNALVTHYRIDVTAGSRSYPFMVLMDGTVIHPRIEEK